MHLPAVVFLALLAVSGTAAAGRGQATTPPPAQPAPGQPAPGQPATPPRAGKPNEPPKKGSAVIRGFVVAADTGLPLRRAQVRASAQEGQASAQAQTDADGRFELKDLPAGRYSITASKTGFVAMQYGQRRPGQGGGTPITLADTQIAEKVAFALARGAAIGGTVVDEFGEPVAAAQVQALRQVFQAGARRLLPAWSDGSSDRTDDRGGYRLYGLPPGEYLVSATLRSVDNFGTTTSTVSDGYAPTYYPASPSPAEAQRVVLRAGQDMQNVSITLVATKLSRITGRVVAANGEPMAAGTVRLMARNPDAMSADLTSELGGMATVKPDGGFQLSGLPPGRYSLMARPNTVPGRERNLDVGRTEVTVGGADIDNLLIVLAPPGIVRGRIVTDAGETPPFKAAQINVYSQASEPGDSVVLGGGSSWKINDDFTFELAGALHRSLIRVSVNPAAGVWSLRNVFTDGGDVTDSTITVEPGGVLEDVRIVVTDKVTEISGTLTGDRNRPVSDASIVLFPSDRERWTYQSRFMRMLRPDTEGRYRARIAPGEDYLLIAVQNLEDGRWNDPEFLERARTEGKRFSIGEGETKVVDLKLSGLQP